MRVVGFSLVRQANQLDFPIVQAIQSVLPLCDELIVNVGPSDDGTRQLLSGLGDPRIRLIDGLWDVSLGSALLAVETQRVLDKVEGDWAVYVQADEVLHPADLAPLHEAMGAALAVPEVEGLLVEFRHFYGTPEWVAEGRPWYRREVRIVRPGGDVRSHQDAQGFRVGPNRRRIRARATGARYFHYGWTRPLSVLRTKREVDNQLYHPGTAGRPPLMDRLPWQVGLRRFREPHPDSMAGWIAARREAMSPGFAPAPPWSWRRVQFTLDDALYRLTGRRPFEYRNYREV